MREKKRAHLCISGRVQGVCFRLETRRSAQALGVTGWVRNRSDGSVEAVCEGDDADVQSLIEWCRRGPRLAQVDEVAVKWEPFSGEYGDFDVTR